MIRFLIILFILTFPIHRLFGQHNRYIIEGSTFVGSNFKLTDAVNYDFTSYGFQIKRLKQKRQDKNWLQYYNLPKTGQELLFSQYSSNGYSIALNTFIEFDLLRTHEHEVFISPSLGLAYTSITSTNLLDYRLTSLPINISVKFGLGYRYLLSKNWSISAGYFLSHFSNGNISAPNDGLNMKAWRFGVTYDYDKKYIPKSISFEKPSFKRFFGQASIGMSLRSNSDKNYFGFVNGYANAGISIHPYHRMLAGIGVFNDNPYSEKGAGPRLGFSVGYQIIIGRIGFSFQPGWYINSKTNSHRYYQINLQYHFDSPLFLHGNLRTTQSFFSKDIAMGIGIEI